MIALVGGVCVTVVLLVVSWAAYDLGRADGYAAATREEWEAGKRS